MRLLLLLCFAFLFFGAAQGQSAVRHFKAVGMRVEVPAGFAEAAQVKKGTASTYLLSIRQGDSNYMNITAPPFRAERDAWTYNNEQLKELVYLSMWEETNGAAIDTATTQVLIDEVPFEEFRLTVRVSPKSTMTMCLLSRLHRGYNLGITYQYVDDKAKQAFEQMLRSCTLD